MSKRISLAEIADRWLESHECLNCACLPTNHADSLASLLRRIVKRERKKAYSEGYAAGHEDQMKMRIADAMERKPAAGRSVGAS